MVATGALKAATITDDEGLPVVKVSLDHQLTEATAMDDWEGYSTEDVECDGSSDMIKKPPPRGGALWCCKILTICAVLLTTAAILGMLGAYLHQIKRAQGKWLNAMLDAARRRYSWRVYGVDSMWSMDVGKLVGDLLSNQPCRAKAQWVGLALIGKIKSHSSSSSFLITSFCMSVVVAAPSLQVPSCKLTETSLDGGHISTSIAYESITTSTTSYDVLVSAGGQVSLYYKESFLSRADTNNDIWIPAHGQDRQTKVIHIHNLDTVEHGECARMEGRDQPCWSLELVTISRTLLTLVVHADTVCPIYDYYTTTTTTTTTGMELATEVLNQVKSTMNIRGFLPCKFLIMGMLLVPVKLVLDCQLDVDWARETGNTICNNKIVPSWQ